MYLRDKYPPSRQVIASGSPICRYLLYCGSELGGSFDAGNHWSLEEVVYAH